MIVRETRSLLGGLGYLCVQGALTSHLAFDAGRVLVSATLLGRFRALGFVLARCSTDSLRLRRVEWGVHLVIGGLATLIFSNISLG